MSVDLQTLANAVRRFFLAALALLLVRSTAGAQITLDGTLGPKGPLTGPNFVIPATVGQQVGGNLFQSFGQFNIRTSESATFTGPNSVQNVIGRVTGGDPSVIDGKLSCTIPNADLFLINPNGVMFGPNATLDVHGSFAASTADYARLADGGRFDVRQPGNSVLTSAPPAAFGFLSQQPAAITIDHSDLKLPDGKAVSLIGGDITMTGAKLTAAGGQVNLASVAAPGEVVSNAAGTAPSLDIKAPARGTIAASQQTEIIADDNAGGTILIRGGRFELQDASTVTAFTTGAGNGGGIDVQVDTLNADNNSLIAAGTSGAGRGGDLTVSVGSLSLTGGARIGSVTTGTGAGGNVTISATGPISVSGNDASGSFSSILSLSGGTESNAGDAGDVTVQAATLSLNNGGEILASTAGSGNAGNIRLSTSGTLTVDGGSVATNSGSNVVTSATGRGGDIAISASDITLVHAAQIEASTFGSGDAGSVTVKVRGALTVDGGFIDSDSGNSSVTAVTGSGGDVEVSAAAISLENSGQIDTESWGPGKAGDVTVQTTRLSVNSGAQIGAGTFGPGKAGGIAVTATGPISISGMGSGVVSNSNGTETDAGDAGNVTVQAATLSMDSGAQIGAGTFGPGKGGSIAVTTSGAISISGTDGAGHPSGIFSNSNTTQTDAGDGGTVAVQAATLSISDGGQVGALTKGPGKGGDVTVTATRLISISGTDPSGNFPSGIFGDSEGGSNAGDAGQVTVTTEGTLEINNGAGVFTSATQAFGGSLSISAGLLDLNQGRITTSVGTGNGDGGNVTIQSGSMVLQDSQVKAHADVGNGGNITIGAQAFFASPDSIVDASSNEGINGTVHINSPDTNITGVLAALPQTFLKADTLLDQRCAARAGHLSSLVVVGRDALPLEPSAFVRGQPRTTDLCP